MPVQHPRPKRNPAGGHSNLMKFPLGHKAFCIVLLALAATNVSSPAQVLSFDVKDIDGVLSSPKTGDGARLRWGQDSIVVSTFPRP